MSKSRIKIDNEKIHSNIKDSNISYITTNNKLGTIEISSNELNEYLQFLEDKHIRGKA